MKSARVSRSEHRQSERLIQKLVLTKNKGKRPHGRKRSTEVIWSNKKKIILIKKTLLTLRFVQKKKKRKKFGVPLL